MLSTFWRSNFLSLFLAYEIFVISYTEVDGEKLLSVWRHFQKSATSMAWGPDLRLKKKKLAVLTPKIFIFTELYIRYTPVEEMWEVSKFSWEKRGGKPLFSLRVIGDFFSRDFVKGKF